MTLQDKSPRLEWILPIAFIVIGIGAGATVWLVTVLKTQQRGCFHFFCAVVGVAICGDGGNIGILIALEKCASTLRLAGRLVGDCRHFIFG